MTFLIVRSIFLYIYLHAYTTPRLYWSHSLGFTHSHTLVTYNLLFALFDVYYFQEI